MTNSTRRTFLKAAAFSGTGLLTAGMKAQEKKDTPLLRFSDSGTFKIAQFTDTHYRTDKLDIAKESVRLIEEIIDTEKPQLVVYTGDIVVRGDIYQGWDDILAPSINSQTPWAVVLGNHDDEGGVSRQKIIDHIKDKPYSVTEPGPENIQGVGNYVLKILDGEKPAVLLYCLDSNAYSTIKGVGRYGWFGADQIQWYRDQSAELTRKNGGTPLPSLAFFHIPLNEYGEMVHFKGKMIGDRKEDECPGAANSGMFLAMLESRDVMGVFVGHDHVNDYVGLWKNVALGYGRFSGTKTTYVKEPHGSRIIELSPSGGRSFKTWIRLRGGEKIHEIQIPQDLIAEKKK